MMEQTYLGPTSTPNVRLTDSSPVNEKTESKQSTEKKPPVSDQSNQIAQTILKKQKKEVSQSHSDFPPKQSKSKEEISTSPPKPIEELLIDSQDLELKQSAQALINQTKEFNLIYGGKDKKTPGLREANKQLGISKSNYFAALKAKTGSQEEQLKKAIELNSALYAAVQQEKQKLPGMEEDDREKLASVLARLEKEYEEAIQAAHQKIEKLKDAPLKLKTLSFNDPISSEDPLKFSCTAIRIQKEAKPTYPYEKADTSQQAWAKENKAALKEFKQKLKQEMTAQVQKTLTSDVSLTTEVTKPSFILQNIKDRFAELNNKLNSTSNPSTQVKILNEIVDLMDQAEDALAFMKADRSQAQPKVVAEFSKFYMEYAKGLYKDSAEAFYKEQAKGKVSGEYNPTITPSHVEALKNYTSRAVKLFDTIIPEVKQVEAEKLNKLELENADTPEEIAKRVSDYFKTLIRMHKGLSHSRFTELFNIHQRFVSRLTTGLALLQQDKQQSETAGLVHHFICSNLMPQITLQETTKHRASQGKHELESSDRKHRYLKQKINPYVGWLTFGSPLSFENYECAHVVAFPGLFANRRESPSEVGRQHVSKAYYETSQEQAVTEDINAIHKKYGHDPEQYAERLLDLTLRLAMEESSKTVHLPSIFNQEVDGASEKYIIMEDLGEERAEIEKTYKELHSTKEEASTSPVATKGETTTSKPIEHTTKIYKFILAHNIFNMFANKMDTKTYQAVLKQEENYIRASKLSLARRIEALQGRAEHMNPIEKLVIACALINVFYGIKNAEAKAGVDLEAGDKEVLDAIYKLQQTIQGSK